MRQYLPNVALFVLLAGGLAGGWWYVDRTYFPKPEPKAPEPPREAIEALAGAVVGRSFPALEWAAKSLPEPRSDDKPQDKPKDKPKPVEPAKGTPLPDPELIALGEGADKFATRALLTTRGGAIQQLTLNHFDEANRIGLEVKRPDGQPQPLRLIPGVLRPRDKTTLKAEAPFPDLVPGKVTGPDARAHLSEPSYLVLHYPADDDPDRGPDGEGPNDKVPSTRLRDAIWKVVDRQAPADGSPHKVAFETELGAPYFLKLRKTFTLAPQDYHVGFELRIEPLPGHVKGKGKFRYQIAGARGLPVEGEWYTQAYRNVMIGWTNRSGSGAKRTIEDALTIHTKHGGDRVDRGDNQFSYAAVATQYFVSAIAIDDDQPAAARLGAWEYVRPTREPEPWDDPSQLFLGDVTVRAVSPLLDIGDKDADAVVHKYVIYNGPLKVRLLKQLGVQHGRDETVRPELVDRYLDNLTLRTLTDYHSPNFFGRLANSIWWSDIVITFTNLMHGVLGGLHSTGLPWGVCIILLTVCVRLILVFPSRKQQATMARMQEKMAKMKPELDKLQEKFKDDPQGLQQEKAKLMFKHGVNPLSTMSGCLLLFAQMPVFMGLYFCLQESVFFRLQPFLWFPNLAAPDMLVWWTEQIPWVSAPENLGGTIYLGPFLNILPILSVTLIFIQQKLTMPPPTDEQQEMQQKMMKFMVVFMAVFFYKVPSGLCLYFICSTAWALAERKLIPKPAPAPDAAAPAGPLAPGGAPGTPPPEVPAPGMLSKFRTKLRSKLEEMQQQADSQATRQIRNDGNAPIRNPDRSDKDKKKKRKR